MPKCRTFISFDYDHDEDLKILLVGQAKNPDSPFEFTDQSLKEPLVGDWKEKIRRRIRNVDVVAVICGQHTHTASGVAAEVTIAREERVPYFLLHGRADKNCTKPTSALPTDKLYNWTWENLKALFAGRR
jgi:hypothetical protein